LKIHSFSVLNPISSTKSFATCPLHIAMNVPSALWSSYASPGCYGIHRFVATAVGIASLVLFLDLPANKSCCAANTASRSSTDAEAADDRDDSDVDLHLSSLVVPSRFSGKYNVADRLKFSNEVRGLLLEGFKDEGNPLEAAKKHFESANRLPVIDPRAPYAYGLVQLAHNRSATAIEQFRVAARGRKVPYLPGLQALAWANLAHGDLAQALPALLDLAKRLEEPQEWPAAEDRENSAEWLGRVIGFLTGPGKVPAQASQIDKLAADMGNALTAERKAAFDRGRKASAARYDELKAQAARPESEALAELNQRHDELASASETARREVRLIESELATLKKAHDRQLAELARTIHDNAMKVKTTTPRISAAEAEIEGLSEPKKHASVRTSTNRRTMSTQKVVRDENAGEKRIRESQLASARKKLEHIKSSLDEAKKAVEDAKTKRAQEQESFRQETAPKRQSLAAAQQKAAQLAARTRQAEKGPLTAEQLKSRLTTLQSYVPLYPELERDRLLASLKIGS
jgi:hypothetical protein